jgi:ABC-type multidrug transport system fused ATPase/permease subunit
LKTEERDVSFCELFRFATKNDKILLAVAITSTIAIGASSPIFYFFLGDIINSFGSEASQAEGWDNLFKGIYLAAGSFVAGMVAYTSWAVIG